MAKKKTAAPKSKSRPFEKSLSELEKVVEELEGGDLGLSDSLKQYERGVGLLKECHQALEAIERKIQILTKTDEGSAVFSDFPVEDSATNMPPGSSGSDDPEIDDRNRLF